ncbi:MAG: transcription termination factor NusA [bacterium]|nr:transcription termination factor NusA [bacterium]
MADAKEIGAAIKQICEEKGIPFESVIESIEAALAVAYRKEMAKKGKDIRVEFNPNDGSMRVFEVYTVAEDDLYKEYIKEKEEREKAEAAGEVMPEPEESKRPAYGEEQEDVKKKFNPKTDIALKEALEEDADIEIGDEIRDELEVPEEYGRMAAQTAKQVIIQKLREAERETLYNLYKDRSGEVINGMVQRVEGRVIFVDLGQAIAVMPPGEQIRGEVYKATQRIKVLLLSIEKTNKGPEIVASRSHPNLVSALFTAEVPEIAAGSVEIKGVSREAGSRSKISVTATDPSIDPIGSCVGQRGTRVQTVINELGGEKIDIIEYDEDPVKYIVNAMSPAKIMSVVLNEEDKTAVAEVQEDQFSLAIGRSGQNVRLASRLAGWSIDIRKAEGSDDDSEDSEKSEDETTGDEEKDESKKDSEEKNNNESTEKDVEQKDEKDDVEEKEEESKEVDEKTEEQKENTEVEESTEEKK